MRILIVDDHEPVRQAIRSLLDGHPTLSICGEAADGVEALELARQLRPDVILMDLCMPRMDGIEATRLIRRELPQCEVIIISQNDPLVFRQQAEKFDARGFVAKADLSRDLLGAIERISALRSKAQSFVGGEMGERIRSFDWSKTPLGPVESWSPALRMMTQFLLANRFPQLLWWGPRFCCIYNDAYIPVLGDKHPWALGRPNEEVWREIWDVLKPLIETPFHGGPATWMEDIPLEINRKGFVEETHFTIAYSPVPDETVPGGIGGVLATVNEITAEVVGDRRVVTLRDLGVRSAEPKTAHEALRLASEILSRHPTDLPFVLFYLLDDARHTAHLVSATGADVNANDSCILQTVELGSQASFHAWPFAAALETGQIQFVSGLEDKFQRVPQGPWSDPPTAAAVVPLRSNIAHQLAGFMVAGVSARLKFDDGYRNFLELLSTQVSTMVASARAYEEERERTAALAEIDRAKTEFFSNVSHEFRTPLTLMLGPLEDAIAQSAQFSHINRERLELAHRNSLRLLKLVNALLDFSRIEAGRLQASYEPTDLAQFTAELAGVFRSAVERAGMRLIIDCPPLPENVYVDREMWEKIVFNLLSNAFKFTFDGEIAVSLRATDSGAELTVRDTGTGIPAEEIPKLFERFHRVRGAHGRSFEGSGIGLALVQELAKHHGGNVRAESRVNEGTAFTVTIPFGKDHLPAGRIGGARTAASTAIGGDAYVQEALRWLSDSHADDAADEEIPAASLPSSTEPLAPIAPQPEQRPRILLADDNADMREYVQRLLRDRYDVVAVADGQAALETAHQHPPDLILSDVMMPKLDGFALLQALRSDPALKLTPVILLSARAGEESRIDGLDAGADDYLIKPFSARELLARIKSRLEVTRVRREATGLLAAIVDSSDDAIVSKDLNGFITSWNKGAERIFGYSAQEAVGKNITLIIPPERLDEETNILRRIRSGERIDHFETIRMRKNGTLIDISVTISPVKDATGRIVGASKVARDISERKRSVEALRQSEERFRMLSERLDSEVRLRTRELEKRNADILRQSQQVRELSWRVLRTQDEERRHIARELHDSAGQTLAVLGMMLATMVRNVQKKAPEIAASAEKIDEVVQQLTKEIRTTSYLLHPPLLDENGLPAALSWYLRGLSDRSGLDITFHISEEFGRLPRDMELVVFRLVQECLANIHRHSGSKTAVIEIARDSERVLVEVRDQGKGIAPERMAEIQSKGSGVGISGIRERLRQFNGEMIIQSDPSGTTVVVTVPLTAGVSADSSADTRASGDSDARDSDDRDSDDDIPRFNAFSA
jgi:PAS domain S-box-containing protein